METLSINTSHDLERLSHDLCSSHKATVVTLCISFVICKIQMIICALEHNGNYVKTGCDIIYKGLVVKYLLLSSKPNR